MEKEVTLNMTIDCLIKIDPNEMKKIYEEFGFDKTQHYKLNDLIKEIAILRKIIEMKESK